MPLLTKIRSFVQLHAIATAGSYSIIFFSQNRVFAFLLFLSSMVYPAVGLAGHAGTIIINLLAWLIGLPDNKTRIGLYGFNGLLVSLAIGALFQPGYSMLLLIPIAMIITLLFTVLLDGMLSKYNLPFLSLPFLFALWLVFLSWILGNQTGSFPGNLLATDSSLLPAFFDSIEQSLIQNLPEVVGFFFKAMASIFFSGSVLAGVVITIGILIFSRIAFLLSAVGFLTAFFYHQYAGMPVNGDNVMQFGFNYILTAIALGGFFYIPSAGSFLLSVLSVPVVSIFFSASAQLLSKFELTPLSLPFNLAVISTLYILMFRAKHFRWIQPALVQTYSPENNLYGHHNDVFRFGKFVLPVSLPVSGPWKVSQGHDGDETHRDDYRHAWDFQVADDQDAVFQNAGHALKDYYCFGKPVYAPADGIIEEIVTDIPDNPIGEINQTHNWGNTVVIKHTPYLFSKLSHLKEQSVLVKKGDSIKKGDIIGQVGNSGRSPFPHLHFQLQSTPFIGSHTLHYPLSSFYILDKGNTEFVEQGIPELNQTVMTLLPDLSLRRVFHLIPGMEIEMVFSGSNGQADSIVWNVMSDMANQYYIKCSKTNAVAYFTVRNDVFYFLSYYGSRKTLLYKFYTGFHKIITGIEKTAVSHDRIPINMGKFKSLLLLQDFVAPFVRFMTFSFSAQSEKPEENPLSQTIKINTEAVQRIFGIKLWNMKSTMLIDSANSISIVFEEKNKTISVQCNVTYTY
ncbi:MAG: urea transporter [Bacteroidales bacterium]